MDSMMASFGTGEPGEFVARCCQTLHSYMAAGAEPDSRKGKGADSGGMCLRASQKVSKGGGMGGEIVWYHLVNGCRIDIGK